LTNLDPHSFAVIPMCVDYSAKSDTRIPSKNLNKSSGPM